MTRLEDSFLEESKVLDSKQNISNKNVIQLILPCGSVVLEKDNTYEIKRCQLEVCDPDKALETIFVVTCLDAFGIARLKVENKENIVFKWVHGIEKFCSYSTSLRNIERKEGIQVEQDSDNWCSEISIEITKEAENICIWNKSSHSIIVRDYFLPNDIITMSVGEKLLSLNGIEIVSFKVINWESRWNEEW